MKSAQKEKYCPNMASFGQRNAFEKWCEALSAVEPKCNLYCPKPGHRCTQRAMCNARGEVACDACHNNELSRRCHWRRCRLQRSCHLTFPPPRTHFPLMSTLPETHSNFFLKSPKLKRVSLSCPCRPNDTSHFNFP